MAAFKDAIHRLKPSNSDDHESFGSSHEKDVHGVATYAAPVSEEKTTAVDPTLNPGALSFEEDAAGGLGRHLGVFSCTMLIIGRIIGTGIFSTPSSILGSVDSVGASLMLWVLGFLLAFSGLFVWLELGTMFPRSGGEKVYLEAVYKKPKSLATVFFATQAILLGFTASGCIVFANNILIVAGVEATRWNTRGIALGVITFVTLIHGFTPKAGLWLMNALSVFKVFILAFIIVTGWVVLGGKTRITDPHRNFVDAFAGSSHSSGDYATAMFKVINAYAGWSNINYVLNEVKDPVRTLKIAGPLGLGLCAVFYIFANIAYFAAASKEEILASKVTVASLFFNKVFGAQAQKALTVFVGLSALGNKAYHYTDSTSLFTPELAKEGIPLPFGNKFWASNWPTGKSPFPGLIVHLIPSVIVIIAPPPDVVYPFVLNVEGYPQQIINLLIVFGLFYLRWKKPNAVRPFKVWWPVALFFMAVAVFLIIDPYLKPSNGVGDTPPLPYYLYCLVGIGILACGVLYWAVWRIILPKVFGYELYPTKETLKDGTVVTVFKSQKIQ
ncbi:high affinity methionine permease [Fomitiporia mediterranea MF3/22]|uniref:high affinity methionine permease n=1 Tax=Fomitiporia mediterranea (strain MF3/22) TaxID=694068 RepID=UPI0004408E7A|nr:high affinity methionine permease [Fomitiporia mediterranea MF3/22]EJD08041.1 high affinity methionine permease [Fomitiporia mediterranea MF3/22]